MPRVTNDDVDDSAGVAASSRSAPVRSLAQIITTPEQAAALLDRLVPSRRSAPLTQPVKDQVAELVRAREAAGVELVEQVQLPIGNDLYYTLPSCSRQEMEAVKVGQFLYDPDEDHLVRADTEAAAQKLIERGGFRPFHKFTDLRTMESMDNLPVAKRQRIQSQEEEEEKEGGVVDIYSTPAPERLLLPRGSVPKLHDGPGTAVEKTIEFFEVKVVDTKAEMVYSPMRMWGKKKRSEMNLGGDSKLTQRLSAYYAAVMLTEGMGADELGKLGASQLNEMGKKERSKKVAEGKWDYASWWHACIAAYNVRHNANEQVLD